MDEKRKLLRQLADDLHKDVHIMPDTTHGFEKEDVMAAAVILHSIVMDYGANYLLQSMELKQAAERAREWGETVHNQVLEMTGVDTYDYVKGGEGKEVDLQSIEREVAWNSAITDRINAAAGKNLMERPGFTLSSGIIAMVSLAIAWPLSYTYNDWGLALCVIFLGVGFVACVLMFVSLWKIIR